MLYIFHVDTGTMLTFDMNLAMESVTKLQEVISKNCEIAQDKQVLLINGGESLDPAARVCTYSAGTDTNPIFLFSKSTIEAATPPSASVNYGSESDLQDQVEGSINMPATYETIVARTQLALQFHDVAKDEFKVCERLVHDQHLQHQGWAAVIANLEDITSAFKRRSALFKDNIAEYLTKREAHRNILAGFTETVKLLSRIPILPCLLPALGVHLISTAGEGASTPPKTLLDWISAQDSRNTLEQMAQQCHTGLQQLDDAVRDNLLGEVSQILEAIDNPSMKEVKGLEDRLFGLEQLMLGARKIVQDQGEMAQGFVQNQNRARNLQDASVLPDLCNSHKRQLLVMLKNHQNLRDIRRRCMAAKEELSVNLHTRLRWVMYVEKSILGVDSKLVIHHETLKKLKRRLEIVRQMHSAPDIYCAAVIEVLRRKTFSHKFLQWADNLCEEFSELHQEEIKLRKAFTCRFKHHFLQSLFPGFEDMPPAFATRSPAKFDEHLPPIQSDDLSFLIMQVPELEARLRASEEDPQIGERFSIMALRKMSNTMVLLPCDHILQQSSESAPRSRHPSDVSVSASGSGRSRHCSAGEQYVKVEVSMTQDGSAEAASVAKEDADSVPRDMAVSQSVEVLPTGEAEVFEMAPVAHTAVKLPTVMRSVVLPVGRPTGASNQIPKAQSTSAMPQSPSESPEGPPIKMEKRETRSMPGASPENVEEAFMTADFYIDESMPSSMTESAHSRKLAELQHVVQDKVAMIECQERELELQRETSHQLRSKLAKAEENFKLLQDVAEKGALQLKCDMLSVEKQIQKDKDEFQTFMDSVTKKLVCTIASFEEEQVKGRDDTLQSLKAQQAQVIQDLEDKLELESQKLLDGQNEIDVYDRKLKEKLEELDLLQQEKASAITALKDDHAKEMEVTKNQLILDQEIELEKVRSDMMLESVQKDRDLQEFKELLEERDSQVKAVELDKIRLEESLTEKFQTEKVEIRRILEEEFQSRAKQLEVELRSEMETNTEETVVRLTGEHDKKLTETCAQLRDELQNERVLALESLKTELNTGYCQSVEELKADSQKKTASELDGLRAALVEEHEQVIRKMAAEQAVEGRGVDAGSQTEGVPEEFISLQQHGETLAHIKEALYEDKAEAVHQALTELRGQHEREVSELLEKLEKDKHDSLQSVKCSFTAEKQVLFNEALSKAVADKDKRIEELEAKETEMKEQLSNIKGELELQLFEHEKPTRQRSNSESQTDEEAQQRRRDERLIQRHLEEELASARQQVLQLQSQMLCQSTLIQGSPPSWMGQSAMAQSVLPLDMDLHGRTIQELQNMLRSKEDEMGSLQRKVMELSMTTSSRSLVQDKVSITTCNINDVVLLCLDERHDHYVVFTVGTTLHFLHSECLETLNLKTSPREARRSWVLAEITDKEYCQAKKPQNRYKVPVGTKFYRVKARPWDRDAVLQHQQQQQQQQKQVLQQQGQDMQQLQINLQQQQQDLRHQMQQHPDQGLGPEYGQGQAAAAAAAAEGMPVTVETASGPSVEQAEARQTTDSTRSPPQVEQITPAHSQATDPPQDRQEQDSR